MMNFILTVVLVFLLKGEVCMSGRMELFTVPAGAGLAAWGFAMGEWQKFCLRRTIAAQSAERN